MITSDTLKNNLEKANIISFEYDVKGSRVFLPNGWLVRNKIFNKLTKILSSEGYEEVGMPNLVSQNSLNHLDSIHEVSKKYSKLSGFNDVTAFSASHEAVFFTFAKRYLENTKYKSPRHIKWFFIAPVLRKPKNSESPFNFGERNSFFQIFFVAPETQNTSHIINSLWKVFDDFLFNELRLPVFSVERPLQGNIPLYNKCYAFECVLKSGRTFSTGLIYDQGNLFSNAYFTELSREYVSIHAGITDNTIYSFFATHGHSDGFIFPSEYAPYQVELSYQESSLSVPTKSLADIKKILELSGIDYKCSPRSSRSTRLQRKQAGFEGIPVFASIDQNSIEKTMLWVSLAIDKRTPIKCSIHELPKVICGLIKTHDEKIDPAAMINSALSKAQNLDETNKVLKSRKIAIINANEISKYSSEKLLAGEILGKAYTPNGVNSHHHYATDTNDVVFISRRV